jgi:hypothetical protein
VELFEISRSLADAARRERADAADKVIACLDLLFIVHKTTFLEIDGIDGNRLAPQWRCADALLA